jgi:hypothetical protein
MADTRGLRPGACDRSGIDSSDPQPRYDSTAEYLQYHVKEKEGLKGTIKEQSFGTTKRKDPALCLVQTGRGSSYPIAHVLHFSPPPPADSFVRAPTVININSITIPRASVWPCPCNRFFRVDESFRAGTRAGLTRARSLNTWFIRNETRSKTDLPE